MEQIALGIGSNIERETNIRLAVKNLRALFGEIIISNVYQTKAVGFTGPDFYNMVAVINTDLKLEYLVTKLHEIESNAGRIRQGKSMQSRCLDIDVLLFGQHNLRHKGHNIPREEIYQTAYVLKPLADVLPTTLDPIKGATFGDMWQSFERTSEKLHKIDLLL